MPRSPTSGKDIDAIARRRSETDFTSPAATWALLSSDYPQLGSNRLAALREALEVAINTSSDTAKTDFPLTPRVLQGLAYGAGSALSTGARGDVPRTATARWLNAAGLLLLLAGHHERALAHLEAARALPFGAVHLNIDKNRHWAAHLSPEPDRAYADVEIPGAELVSPFKRLAAFVDGDPDDVAEVAASSGVSPS